MSYTPVCAQCDIEISMTESILSICRSCGSEFHRSCINLKISKCPNCDIDPINVKGEDNSVMFLNEYQRTMLFTRNRILILTVYFLTMLFLTYLGIQLEINELTTIGILLFAIPIMVIPSYMLLERRVMYLIRRTM